MHTCAIFVEEFLGSFLLRELSFMVLQNGCSNKFSFDEEAKFFDTGIATGWAISFILIIEYVNYNILLIEKMAL